MKKIIGIFIVTLLIGSIASQVSACTGFSYNDENNVFACHNDDGGDFNINLRFFPPKEDKHGMVIFEFGFPESDGTVVMAPCAGMNDQGFWFNSYGTPNLVPVNSRDKPYFSNPDCYYEDPTSALAEYCTAKCSNIGEAIDIIDDYNLEEWSFFQLLVADVMGNSAIIEGDDIIYKEDDFQVVSNFLQSHPELGGLANAFERYDTAVSMLENMTEPSVEYFSNILDAVHLSGTVYSIVCDLENLIIYLYFLHDYEKLVVIDLNEEFAKGEHYIYIGSLFEPEGNKPPAKPEPPTGNESGTPGKFIDYSVKKTNDPDGDQISYIFDWGDGNQSVWLYKSMGTIKYSHNWTKRGTYEVKVKARDIYGSESEWSDPLVVNMPKNKSLDNFNPWISRLIERFPILVLIL